MTDIIAQQSAVTTVFSGASVASSVTKYTDTTGIAYEGFDWAVYELEVLASNTTDDFEFYFYSTISGTSSGAAQANEVYEQPFISGAISPWTATRTKTVVVSDVPYCFVGMIAEPSSTSFQTQVKVTTYKWVTV